VIYVRTLGTAEIEAGDVRIKSSAGKKFALLLYLCAEPGRRVTRRQLHDLLFPALSEKNARHTLRELVYQLKQSGVEDLVTDDEGIAVRAEAVRSDYSEVVLAERPDVSQLRAIEGGFLPGYAPTHSETYAEWFEGHAARTRASITRSLVQQLTTVRSANPGITREMIAHACLAIDPLNEEATLVVAESLALNGAKAAAVRMLDKYIDEVGTGPKELTLQASILRKRIGERLSSSYGKTHELPFIGRQAELDRLEDLLDLARSGNGQSVVIIGEPGMGKSRLSSEFAARARLRGATHYSVKVQAHDIYRPLSAFLTLAPQMLSQRGALGCSPSTLELLRGSLASDQVLGSDVDERFLQLTRAIIDLLSAVAGESLTLIELDDGHWLDEKSLELLSRLPIGQLGSKLLVTITSRSGSQVLSQHRNLNCVHSIVLRGLDSTAAAELVAAGLPEVTRDSEVALWITATSDGNPLFITTLISHYAATRSTATVPQSLSDLIHRRLAEISPTALALLEILSALGRHANQERLEAVAGLPFMSMLAAFEELHSARLLERSVDKEELTRPHSLISDAIDRIAPRAMSMTHAKVADSLEREARSSNDATLLWDSAEHWLAAFDYERAADGFMACARQTALLGRPREAAELLCRAAEQIDGPIAINLAEEAIRISGKAQELDVAVRAGRLLRRLGRQLRHDDVELTELEARLSCLDDTSGIERLRSCISSATSDPEHRFAAARVALVAADYDNDPGLAAAAYDVIKELRITNPELGLSLETEAMYHTAFGDSGEALEVCEQMLEIAKESPPEIACGWRRYAGVVLWRLGLPERCFQVFELALEDARLAGRFRMRFTIAVMLGSNAKDVGDTYRAQKYLAEAEQLADEAPDLRITAHYLGHAIDQAVCHDSLTELHSAKAIGDRVRVRFLSTRLVRMLRSLDAMLSIYERKPFDCDSLVRSLVEHHQLGVESGNNGDLEVAAAILAYLQRDRITEARSTVVRYLTHYRRNRVVLWESLQHAMAKLDAAEAETGSKEAART
jgi:DNA-binding SARP family transcriptional activator/tetratricopeptide (TPR) repeat protein